MKQNYLTRLVTVMIDSSYRPTYFKLVNTCPTCISEYMSYVYFYNHLTLTE